MNKDSFHNFNQQPYLRIASSNSEPYVIEIEAKQLCNQILNIENIGCNFNGIAEEARRFCNKYSSVSSEVITSIADITEYDIDILGAREISLLFAERTSALREDALIIDVDLSVIDFILTQFAPQGLLSGCQLQNSSNASNCHEVVASALHFIHGVQVGNGNINRNQNVLFRQMLESIGVRLPKILSTSFSALTDILPESWKLPAYRLSLSLFTEEMCPEILGATLFDVTFPIPRLVQILEPYIAHHGGLTTYYKVRTSQCRSNLVEKARLAIEIYLSTFDGLEQSKRKHTLEQICRRIYDGIYTSYRFLTEWSSSLIHHLQEGYLSPREKMIRLVKRKAKYAVGYHSRIDLNGVNFDTAIIDNAETFVDTLGKSQWVSPGNPEKSALLTSLVKFSGPMFRVFSPIETEIINEWVKSLPQEALVKCSSKQEIKKDEIIGNSEQTYSGFTALKAFGRRLVHNTKRLSDRDMYYQLINIEHYPDIRFRALELVTNWLTQSSVDMFRGTRAIPFQNYTHQKLRDWFNAKAQSQVESYSQSLKEIEKPREQVIKEAVQLCPMILIDGAWLQNWCSPGLVDTKIGSILYSIYSDEVGNGEPQLNHPNIYRALIQQMGINLPNFKSLDFAYWHGFADNAFRVPVFWLAISLFPRRFLAETLGLNLAMELSGVGGAYRTARDELRYYGYNTLFVDLHNTIDNVSTGHSAMALDAIDYYMDDILQSNDEVTIREHWERIWIGYRALNPPHQTWNIFARRKNYSYQLN
ncbi:iron-containing redox enzyme family protein [Nostoc parmelioides]|uniref:Iron-containing redox enzyme family protein n=1 Tax=Nostoc parmelioides FACHB-3921 TaxID=2692909 RepID=A0ABR8BN58_9NOSO|nr:iron-containing redox enzyme family protein [Nostoc parmelioides]MBD2255542.1 iron-containing redox enzyme family protein [Nostoc parmelioides FACHB-3921]